MLDLNNKITERNKNNVETSRKKIRTNTIFKQIKVISRKAFEADLEINFSHRKVEKEAFR